MEKYEDISMDFADATLVFLAEEIDVIEILTLDRRGFGTVFAGRRPSKFSNSLRVFFIHLPANGIMIHE